MRAWIQRFRWLPLLAAVLLGIAVRVWQFGKVPVSLYWDEMAMWNDALSVAETGKDLFARSWLQPLFISYGDYKLPVYIVLTTFVARFTSDAMVGVRLVSLLAGISMIPSVYWLVRSLQRLDEKNFGTPWLPAVAAGVMAVLPWSLHFSRVGYEGHLSAALVLLSVAALADGLITRSWRSFFMIWLSSTLGAVAIYTYFSTRFVWPVIVIGLVVVFWSRARARLPWLILSVALWFLALIPMYRGDFYEASNQFRLSASNILRDEQRPHVINAYRERAGNTVVARVLYNQPTFIVRELALNYLQYLDPGYLFLHGDANLRHGTGMVGLMFPSFAPFFVIGVFALLRRKTCFFLWLCAWWAAAVLPAAIPRDVPHALRSLNALPVFVVLVAYGLDQVASWLRSRKGSRVVACAGAAFCLIVAGELVRYHFLNQTVYARTSAAEWQDGYVEVSQYVQNIRDKYVFVYVDRFDDRYYLYYQPYSGMTYAQIQKLPSQDFKRDIYGNVRIRPIDDWFALEKNSVVITRRARLLEGFEVKESIKNRWGEEEFVVVETPRI